MDKRKRYLIIALIGVAAGVFLAFILPFTLLKINDKLAGNNISNNGNTNNNYGGAAGGGSGQHSGNGSGNGISTYEKQLAQRENARNVGVILDAAPEELTSRTEDTFEGTMESLEKYYGASEPIKVDSDEDEFVSFCKEYFFDHPETIHFGSWANEIWLAQCGYYTVYRTEYFNPTEEDYGLYYIIDGGGDGMSLKTMFVYDPSGKYAMISEDYRDETKYAIAKFVGLQFSEENPYVSFIDEELAKLSERGTKAFKGDIWEYAVKDTLVRVVSTEDEFIEYCEEFFKGLDEKIIYEQDRDGIVCSATCGDYLLLRSESIEPVKYVHNYMYEGIAAGDTAPPTNKFFYDCTGKYALVYWGNDFQDELCVKFLGF